MKYKVIVGFHDIVADKGYRAGDTFDASNTKPKRLKELLTYENGLGTPLIAEVVKKEVKKEPEKEPKKPEGEEVVLTDFTFDELKAHADKLGVVYAPNIGHETLLKKFETKGD